MVTKDDIGKRVFIVGIGCNHSVLATQIFSGTLEGLNRPNVIVVLDDMTIGVDCIDLDEVKYDLDMEELYGFNQVGFNPFRYECWESVVFLSEDEAKSCLVDSVDKIVAASVYLRNAIRTHGCNVNESVYESMDDYDHECIDAVTGFFDE